MLALAFRVGHGGGAAGRADDLGLQPGPLLFTEQKTFVWGLIASMYLGNLAGLIVVLSTVPLFAAILRVPFSIVAPMILMVCAIGAFTVHGNATDIWLMLVFGVVGYVFKKLDYPLAPWCWPSCWATAWKTPSARACSPARASWASSGQRPVRHHHHAGPADAGVAAAGQAAGDGVRGEGCGGLREPSTANRPPLPARGGGKNAGRAAARPGALFHTVNPSPAGRA
jgi:hypothetical protein